MGLICGTFSLSNPTRPDLAPMEVTAMAESGAVHLCIPEHLAIQLNLAELERREVVMANGHRRSVPYVGPVEVHSTRITSTRTTAKSSCAEWPVTPLPHPQPAGAPCPPSGLVHGRA